MHESAYRIGELVMQTYCDLPKARILEIGSMDVNGSLRSAAEPTTDYVGVDLEEGPAVDVVVKAGEKLPFDDASFDLIMASSAFEHDPRFWETFIEMCRVARPGGHVYVNAPSNGGVHRYPLDCWRFYPDAGLALVEYAQKQNIQLDLVESFVGKRYPDSWDGWNDFVAIFRRGPTKKSLNSNFVYKRYPSYNARTWKSSQFDLETSLTEDMQLGRDLRQQVADQTEKINAFETERIESDKIREKLTADVRTFESEASQLRTANQSFQQQVGVLSNALQAQTDALSAVREDACEKLEQFGREREEAEKTREKLATDLRISQSEASHLRAGHSNLEQQVQSLSKALQAQTDAFDRIQDRDLGVISALQDDLAKVRADHSSYVESTSTELAGLHSRATELEAILKSERSTASSELACLRDRNEALEDALNRERAHHHDDSKGTEWLRALQVAMSDRPFWWFLLSKRARRSREYKLLRRIGLFDDQAYLSRYSDVKAAGMDALHHYVAHGMAEGRVRG